MAIWFHSSLRQWHIRTRALIRLTESVSPSPNIPLPPLSLSLVGTSRMRQLNRTYRNRDYATDVLAFPADPKRPNGSIPGRRRHLPTNSAGTSRHLWEYPRPELLRL